MSSTTHDSAACCTRPIPNITSTSTYEPKGTYTNLAGTKYYTTGSSDAKRAIFFIYDVFGYQKPTLQGADILASAGYFVAMPDLFDGDHAKLEWLKEDPMTSFTAWRSEKISNSQIHITRVNKLISELKQEYPSPEKWGSIGYCWGGKLIALTSASDSPWSAAVQSSPAMVDPADAEKVTVPMLLLASKDEPADKVAEFEKALPEACKGGLETFGTQIHGWMSARSDLEDPEVRKEYERGYGMAVEFYGKYL